MTYNVETGEYGCKDLVLDNEAYNPIKYYINSAFDPRLWLYDELNRQYYRNTKYDPRRVILNANFNPYKKKWNKWIGDGTTLLADNIMKSELWEMINNGTNKELPAELPVELQSDYINENCPSDLGNDRFETRSYFCPPDLFRYCSNTVNPNVTSAFYYCGGPEYTREGYGEKDYINFGLYGTIPPYLFEPISNVTDLTNIFYYCKGILPYKWPTSTQNGIMYPPQLFTNLTGLKNVSGMFAYGNIYNKCVIEPTQFSKNGELQNVSRLFMNTLWGSDTTLKQLDDGVFTNNKNIKNVSYMLYSGDSHGNNRLPRVVSSGLFTKSNNPKIEDCSYFMTNGQQTSGSVPEFWNWSTITGRTACYRGINTGITNYNSIPDNYK